MCDKGEGDLGLLHTLLIFTKSLSSDQNLLVFGDKRVGMSIKKARLP